jgi:predicted metal-dependent phosphoesterase TrpH
MISYAKYVSFLMTKIIMIEKRFDLHCHTNYSDGTQSPEEVLALAKGRGLAGLSITDHDTIAAYETAFDDAKRQNLEIVPGVEFSASHLNNSVHILGYGFSLKSKSIASLCILHKERRKKRLSQMLDKLTELGMPLSWEDLSNIKGMPGRPHIAMAMLKKGYIQELKEAFEKYLGEGKSAYIPGESPSVEETLAILKEANAIPVIAHPHLIKDQKVILDLLKMGFEGIEGHYANFLPGQCQRWIKIGQRKGWLVTGGSDFHGTVKPSIQLGCSWISEDIFSALKERYETNKDHVS